MKVPVVLAAVLASAAILAGCAGNETPVEQQEQEAGVEEVETVEENAVTPPPAAAYKTVSEADGAKKKAAQKAAQGKEGGVRSGSGDEEMLNLLACQDAEVQRELSPAQADALGEELMQAYQDERKNFQTSLAERGYDCNGTAQEIIERNAG